MVKYGKTNLHKKSKLIINLPKSSFKQFYKVAVFTSLLIYYISCSTYIFGNDVPNWFLNLLKIIRRYESGSTEVPVTKVFITITLIVLQCFRRFYDTHFISVFSKNAKINLNMYIVGITYYPAVYFTVLMQAPNFNANNVKLEKASWTDVTFIDIIAILLFLWAWKHQYRCNVILANLRKEKKGIRTENYKVPEGDWFQYLSSPNLSAEVLIYLSLTILMWQNQTWWFLMYWVIVNQGENMLLTHWWYKEKFDNFPKTRKAVFPFLY